jgi:hypothetical protein
MAAKESVHPALPTPPVVKPISSTLLRSVRAANAQAAIDAFVGTALRHLRRVVELRHQDKPPARCLAELRRVAEAISSTQWALEYDAALRKRGER